jgi:hypothetical protein
MLDIVGDALPGKVPVPHGVHLGLQGGNQGCQLREQEAEGRVARVTLLLHKQAREKRCRQKVPPRGLVTVC